MECLGEDFEDAPQHAGADPLLKPPVAGLIRRIAVRQVGPRGAGPQDPQDAIEHGAVLPPRAPSTVFAARQLGQEGPNEVPLLVREVTGMRRSRKGHPARMARSRSPDGPTRKSVVRSPYSAVIAARSRPYNHADGLALIPGTRLGVYEVIASIGAGGMGEVYRATDTNARSRQVAIKMLPGSRSPRTAERMARFEREAEDACVTEPSKHRGDLAG